MNFPPFELLLYSEKVHGARLNISYSNIREFRLNGFGLSLPEDLDLELDLPEWHAGAAAANREATPHEFQAGSRDDRGHRGELSGQRKPRPSRGPGPRA